MQEHTVERRSEEKDKGGGEGKRVFAIIGSPNDAKSNTISMTLDFLEMVKQYNSSVDYEIFSLGSHPVEPCHGCLACMKRGSCVRRSDELHEIMRRMRECDLLIVGSPVYERHISAQMKALFDRTFMWIHLIGLLGKPVLTAVTAGSDGINPTRRYLSNMLTMMGGIAVGSLSAFAQQPGCFPNREYYREKHRRLAQKTARILSGANKVRPRLINRLFFEFMKFHTRRLYKKDKRLGSSYADFEYQTWVDKGWFHISYRKALENEREAAKRFAPLGKESGMKNDTPA
jgi:multimeric flavodoxin WrbA